MTNSSSRSENTDHALRAKWIGLGAAVITIFIWTAFVVIGRASAKMTLTPFDMVFCRMLGAGLLVGGASLLKAFEGGSVWIGDLLFVCASSSWAMYSVLARKYKVDAVQATIAFTVFAGLCYLPLYGVLAATNNLPFGLVSHLADAPHSEIAFQMLMQGIGSGIVGNIGFTLMLKHFGPVRSTMMTALVPSLASLSAVFFLGEPLYWNLVAGLLLALIGVVIGVMSASKNTVRPELVNGPPPTKASTC